MVSRIRARVVSATVLAALAVGCHRSDQPQSSASQAGDVLAVLRNRLPAGGATGFDAVPHGFRPRFGTSEAKTEARVVLPSKSTDPLHVEDVRSGLGVDVSLRGACEVPGQARAGYVAYPRGHVSGATLVHRPLPNGAEDFVSFAERPSVPAVEYQMTIGSGVKGLRLIANTLEMIDGAGTPRLRVSPPYIVGANGAQTDANLAVDGCAVDVNPVAPWGRTPTPPGAGTCTVRVSWNDQGVVYPAVLDPRWTTTTGALNVARQDHTATVLSNGKVLVAGGRISSTSTAGLNSAELYDPATGTWTSTPTFSGNRYFHTAMQLGTTGSSQTSGMVFIAGGINGTGSPASLASAQLYSASTGMWTTAASMSGTRAAHTATLLSNGNVLLAGGETMSGTTATVLNTADIYNPSSGTGSWTSVSTNMATARRFHTATLLTSSNSNFNNRVLIVGGTTGTGTTSTTSAQLFNVSTSAWSTTTALPAARDSQTATALTGGNVLITGGRTNGTPLATALLFTIPSSGTAATWPSAGTMSSARWRHTATLLSGTNVLVSGGASNSGGTTLPGSAELWNGGTTWTTTATAMSAAVQLHTASLLSSGAVLVAGGSNASGNAVTLSQLYDPSFGQSCTTNSQCATGFCISGVCCDTACNGGCGACNLAGKVGTCSAVTSGTTCRASAGACDVAETCNGTALTCPTDGFAAATMVCRASAGSCDVAEKCTGTSAACPADGFAAATTVCRVAAGVCDVAEQCTGTSAACPTDAFAAATTTCRAAAGTCDVAEKCTGASAACPADAFLAATTVCRAAADVCDVAETCTGSSAACPSDALASATTVCRPANGACDVAETCTGNSTACPADALAPATTVCRAANGACDVAETCTGNSTVCPADGFAPSTTVCRAAAGVCDVAEKCTGTSTTCPADTLATNGTTCNDGNACTSGDKCQAGVCTPVTTVTCPAGDFCRSAGVCDPGTGLCSGATALHEGQLCDDGNQCTTQEACRAGTCVPEDPVTGCTTPGAHYYAPLVNIGSTQGVSAAWGINENGEVVGTDTTASYLSLSGTGAGPVVGFYWTKGAGSLQVPHPAGRAIFPRAVNNSGIVVGTAFDVANIGQVFRFDSTTVGAQPQFIQIPTGTGTAINTAGQITGHGYFPSHWMFRATGSTVLQIPGISGDYEVANAIDDDGTLFGFTARPDGSTSAVRYTDASHFEYLNQLVVPSSDWGTDSANGADALDAAYGTNGTQVVGYGHAANGTVRGFVFTPSSSGVAGSSALVQIPMIPKFAANDWTHAIGAHGVNSNGIVVGAVYDSTVSYPVGAIMWVDGVGTVDLNQFVDPNSGWDLQGAFSINSSREVAGWGYLNGHQRAFKMTVPDLRACPPTACAGPGVRDPRTGECLLGTPVADGTGCSDGDACTRYDYCISGLCRGTPVDCPGDTCRPAGVCDKTTGLCSIPDAVADGTPCDDGNHCSLVDTCKGGTCMPGDTTNGCTGPTDTYYVPVADIGSRQGASFGWAISENGEIVGSDIHNPPGTVRIGPGPMPSVGFRWTPKDGIHFLPQPTGKAVFPRGVNAAGVIAGTTVDVTTGADLVFRLDPSMDDTQLQVLPIPTGIATGINDTDHITGYGYFNGSATPQMYRALGSTSLQVIGGPTGQSFSQANAIDYTGTLIGYTVWSSRKSASAIRYSDGFGLEFLNQLLPAGSDWNLDPQPPLTDGDYLAGATATNGYQIVGYGSTGNGLVRGYSLTPGATGAPGSGTIKQIPMPPNLPEIFTTNGFQVIANGVNDTGEVVGSVYDPSGSYPQVAFIWVDGVGTVDLNQLIDHGSGWVLAAAYAINHNRQVTGFGYLNGQGRAFAMTVPDLSPCPGADVCHTVGPRDLRTGACSPPTPVSGVAGCQENITLRCDGVVELGAGTLVAVFGFKNPTAGTINAGSSVESLNGGPPSNSQPAPPTQFLPGDHPGAFLPTFTTNDNVTWTVDGESVSASASLPHLPAVTMESGGLGVVIGGNVISLGSLNVSPGVVPALLGIAPDGNKIKAIFSYSMNDRSDLTIPYGVDTGNALSDQGGFIQAPSEFPPQTFIRTTHAPFVATLSGTFLTWTVGSNSATARPNSPQLTVQTLTDGTHVAALPDGRKVNLDSVPPADPVPQQDPATAGVYNGTLEGSFAVGPTGAAIYTVPIKMPPAIAGMAPNLGLVYNSQAGDGIAGQGWELTGLSSIYRCPKTRLQDGVASDPTMFPLQGTTADDAFCMDGKRLYLQPAAGGGPSMSYSVEFNDLSRVTRTKPTQFASAFTVLTKNGETRFYGSASTSRVDPPFSGAGSQGTVFLLDRVVDPWGNYYTITYNDGLGDFLSRGILVTKIQYTGHMKAITATGDGDVLPYATITFGYAADFRPDTRVARFGSVVLPKQYLLSSITTPLGTYGLNYKPISDPMLPSLLTSVTYCTASLCVDPLEFDWNPDAGHYDWAPVFHASDVGQANSYEPPVSLLPQIGAGGVPGPGKGVQFVDLNGDGRLDLVESVANLTEAPIAHAWRNTGHGWEQNDSWAPPGPLARTDGTRVYGLFADFDGDGVSDYITTNPVTCNTVGAAHPCDTNSPVVYLNRIREQGGWQNAGNGYATGFSDFGWGALDLTKDVVIDIDGDGRADLLNSSKVLLNTGLAFVPAPASYSALPIGGDDNGHFEDVNHDGLPDWVGKPIPDGVNGYSIAINLGITSATLGEAWGGRQPLLLENSVPWEFALEGAQLIDSGGATATADLNGDGIFDQIWNFADSGGHIQTGIAYGINDSRATGFSYSSAYPLPIPVDWYDRLVQATGGGNAQSPLTGTFSLPDLNSDGLVDFVSGPVCEGATCGTGTSSVNNGLTWTPIPGVTVPALPSPATPWQGSMFIDLNGDGVVDLIQGGLDHQFGNQVWRAWINQYKPPVIVGFPNALAKKTVPSYVAITSPDAEVVSAYVDDLPLDTFVDTAIATRLAIPMKVVYQVEMEDGSGTGSTVTTSYTYHSLRGGRDSRGALGFGQVEAREESAGKRYTKTTYVQGYPYTGLVGSVERGHIDGFNRIASTVTTTQYCDKPAPAVPATVTCSSPGTKYSPGTEMFVYPFTVTDVTYLKPSVTPDPDNENTVATETRYDAFGNSFYENVSTTRREKAADGTIDGETFSRTTTNVYGAPGDPQAAEEQVEGKATLVIVATQSASGSTSHTTQFDYLPNSSLGGASSTLALVKKHIEPFATSALRMDTAYAFDEFGNVVTTTSCATDFDSCVAGATGPTGTSDPLHHAPFRTTQVSFNPADFHPPLGTGLATSITYGPGRFPVRTINAAGHVEYSVYDPLLGVRVQQTGPNGISSCDSYDSIGRETTAVQRCGSGAPLVTTFQYVLAPIVPNDPARYVTVTRPPDGGPSWAFFDDQHKTIRTMKHALDGRLTEVATTYDFRALVQTQSKPFFLGDPMFVATSAYDQSSPFDRLDHSVVDLGVIDASGTNKSITTTMIYSGSGVETDQTISAMAADGTVSSQLESRVESKNALGKVRSVKDAMGSTITYLYDADGNPVRITDSAGNITQITYDSRGRKLTSTDPDRGFWQYAYDGFGDLVTQIDAKNQEVDMTYDVLGRMLTRTDSTGTAEWTYDVGRGAGVGKLAAMVGVPDPNLNTGCTIPFVTNSDGNRAGRSFTYTGFGDVETATDCIDGDTFLTSYQYDRLGRQSSVRYPAVKGSQLAVGYHYTSLGFLQYLTDDSSDYSILWQAKSVNAMGQVVGEVLRNGVETTINRNAATGWMMSSQSVAHFDSNKVIQNWSYTFDMAGNLLSRNREDQVNDATSTETFTYDPLNRLLTSDVRVQNASGYRATDSLIYDALGNITLKGGNTYTYNSGCMTESHVAGPHAVCTVGVGGAVYQYDDNGAMVSGGNHSVMYNPTGRVTHIETTNGSPGNSVDFVYGGDGSRVVQIASSGGTTERKVYVGLGATGKSLYERTTHADGSQEHANFIYAGSVHGGNAFAIRLLASDGTPTATNFFNFDHLGSTTAVSDEVGHVATVAAAGADAGVLGYDPWGARRNPDGQNASPASFDPPPGHREFTGHESIPGLTLVNMNGRVYDPVVGRFLSPDPNVELEGDQQSFNRYSYALNNPLRYTDPTGYFLGLSAQQWLSMGLSFAEVAMCASGNAVGCFALGAIITEYSVSAELASGQSLTQVATTTAIGLAMGEITGSMMEGWSPADRADVMLNMIMGGASAAMSSAMNSALSGRALGPDVLMAAAQGAASAGITAAFQTSAQITQASADPEVGSMRVEVAARDAGASGTDAGSSGRSTKGGPTAAELKENPVVKGALRAAYGDTNAGNSKLAHEEGGWFYMNTKTQEILPIRAPPGPPGTGSKGYYEIDLDHPKPIPGYVVVGTYHAHPLLMTELKPIGGWPPGPSRQDVIKERDYGVPGFVIDPKGIYPFGPDQRTRLDNGLGYPRWRAGQ